MLRTGAILLFTPPSADPEESPGRFLHKIRDSPDKESPPLRSKHASKEARRAPPRRTQWWHHITDPPSWTKGQNSQRKNASSVASQGIPHASFPCLALRKESPRTRVTGSMQEWRLQDMKDDVGIKSTSFTAQDSPHSYLIGHQEKKISEHQAKSWFGPIGIRWASQSKSPPLPPCSRILSQNWCFATRSSRRLCCANRLHHLPLSPSPSSIGRRRRTSLSTKTRSLRARDSWEDGQTSFRNPPYL